MSFKAIWHIAPEFYLEVFPKLPENGVLRISRIVYKKKFELATYTRDRAVWELLAWQSK